MRILVLGLVFLAVTQAAVAQDLTVLESEGDLRRLFEEARGTPRLILFISPT
ncbi:MAG: hypothetical protein AB1758_23775 [Candidatus Eremiobacterota bacterium]